MSNVMRGRRLAIITEFHPFQPGYLVHLQFHYDGDERVEAVMIRCLDCPDMLIGGWCQDVGLELMCG